RPRRRPGRPTAAPHPGSGRSGRPARRSGRSRTSHRRSYCASSLPFPSEVSARSRAARGFSARGSLAGGSCACGSCTSSASMIGIVEVTGSGSAACSSFSSARPSSKRSSRGSSTGSSSSSSSAEAVVGEAPASTQVSLEPPPREEFTTISPSGRATRVSPPGSTHTSSPEFRAKGRRSTWRGSGPSSTRVGTVDSCTSGWAIQPRGSASRDRKSTRLNSSHVSISYAVFCLKKKNEHYAIQFHACYTHPLCTVIYTLSLHDALPISGQSAGQHPHVVTGVQGEGPQVHVARLRAILDQGGDGRQLHQRLGDPAARIGQQ